jgi:Protein of unknown function (DUF2442)
VQQPDITAVAAEPPTSLLLTYSDGQQRRFDCSPYLERGVFVRLKDASLFVQAFVSHGTICWPGELDIAPETLYLRSVPTVVTRATATSL